MKKQIALITLLAATVAALAQGPNVLFIGNSYTEVNDLPGMVADIARSMGDDIATASNTPGGCTFMQHCGNQSMDMIRRGGWDIVVLQEQSQYPSFPQSQVEAEVFPYAERLIDSVYAHNACAEPMLYMTWGRKDGDSFNAQYFPILGTYEGMDSMLCERYTYMAEAYDAALCPVGRVWRYLRDNHRDIELYQSDGSHPTTAGTYAAACAFYTMIFGRDPANISHTAGLDEATARTIRDAVRAVVYDSLPTWRRHLPEVDAAVQTAGAEATIAIECNHCDSMTCHFGDGNDTTMAATDNTTLHHTYADAGTYSISITGTRHCMADTTATTIEIAPDTTEVGIGRTTMQRDDARIYPNPVGTSATIRLACPGEITIISADGRSVATQRAAQGTTTLPLYDLPRGNYIIRITTAAGTTAKKITKN